MHSNQLILLTLMVFILFSSCQPDDDSQIVVSNPALRTYENVDTRLWTYWQNFESEAARRGLSIDLTDFDLIGVFENIPSSDVAGSCSYGGGHPRTITIDTGIWEDLPPLYREFIAFHELGHCVLMRDHDESTDSNGLCRSLMRSGLNGCRDNYNANSRDYYLNELFSNF